MVIRIRTLTFQRWLSLPLLLFSAAVNVAALNPRFSLRQYLHTAWTEADGVALPETRAVAQDSGGYLWLGTAEGLIRFDGIRFHRWEPPPRTKPPIEDVRFVIPARSGGLWVASAGSVWRIRDGSVQSYAAAVSQLGGNVIGLVESESGSVWILSGHRNSPRPETSVGFLSPDGSLREFGPADGVPAGNIMSFAVADGGHSLWLLRAGEACLWSPGAAAPCRPHPVPEILASGQMLKGPVTTEMVLGPDLGGAGAAAASPVQAGNAAQHDVHGSMWFPTYDGLLRFQSGRTERFTREDGLSGACAYALTEDREGDLWVATNGGIDRFRDPTAAHLSMLDGLRSDTTHSLVQTPDGAIWVGAGSGNLDRIVGDRITHVTFTKGPKDTVANGLYVDHTGKLWVGTNHGVFHQAADGFHEVTAPDGSQLNGVRSISGDRAGNIWVIDQMSGLLQVHEDTTGPVASGQMQLPFRVAAASDGTLWAASYKTGMLALRKNGVTPVVLHEGPTQFIYEDRNGETWVGMGSSLSRFRNGRWTTWDAAQGLAGNFLYGLAEDDCGGFWILTEKAVLRLDAAELRNSADGMPRPLRVASYGLAEGLHLTIRGLPSPRIIRVADGRIWFCESTGIGIIDPGALHRNEVPPPVHIERMTWNGKSVPAEMPSFLGGEVHIAYTGVSLAAPDRVRFRYRMEPGGQWIDAGGRRDVTYAGLAPGRYRFHVVACNRDGVWNETGAAIDFRVEPYFYQTSWFFAACAAAVGFSIYGAYRLRVRRLTEKFALVAQERARVTREIHDSLLQGFTGVIYQLDAAARQFDTDPAQSKLKLESALDRADEALREAREMLSTMRLPALENHPLPEALAETGAKLTENTGTSFQWKVTGTVEPLRYEAQANLFLIGREAIANAVTHASASHIQLLLVYGDKELQLSVQDDGAGFDPDTSADREGHWGLRSMRERARQIHAEFLLESAPGKGTRVEVRVRRKQAQTT
ncbi:MAG: hypothetical protein C5B56_16135 [Proteobacteria bacterium]|nr:MAG: hypothetical protein C5B56_16135 [Pseudomonadota bacterium]